MLGGTARSDGTKRSRRRLVSRENAAAAALAALALALFSPLLLRPDRFPAAGAPAIAGGAIADALTRERWERSSGEISYFDPDLGGRNRAVDRTSFYTHPLYYPLSRVLPPGLSLTLVALLHLLLLGLGTHALSRRIGYAHGPALFSGSVAVVAGAAAEDLISPGGMGAAAAAALVPALALVLRGVLDRPSAPRAVLLAMLTALSAAGDLPGLVLALAFAGGAAALLGGAARTVPAAKGGLAAGLGVVLGLALVAYRALPRVLGDPAGYVALDLFREGPFWSGGGPLRLPFFLGSITLLALASALAGQRRDRRALLLTVLSVVIALLSPRALVAFIGLPLALAAGAGAARLTSLLPARVPVGALLSLVLVLEAAPYYRSRVTGRSAAQIAAAPRWVQFLAAASGGERAAVAGPAGGDLGPALTALGVTRAPTSLHADAPVLDPRALGVLGARFLACDLPRAGGDLPLVHSDREAGKYVYLNPERLGLAYWTENVETAGGDRRGPAKRGAVVLPAGSPDPPGDGFGPARDARRMPNGVTCRVDLAREAYLVFTEPNLPGLEARLDGKSWPLTEGNFSQPCVLLPPGRHEVRLVFRPQGLAAGEAVTAVAAALLPILFAVPLLSALVRKIERGKTKPPASASLSASRPSPAASRQPAPRISATSSRLRAM